MTVVSMKKTSALVPYSHDDGLITTSFRYGAVVRGANAYVPPGARKAGTPSATAPAKAADVPKVAINGPDGAAVTSQAETSASSSKGTSPAPSSKVCTIFFVGNVETNDSRIATQPPADPLPAFRDFVTNEKQRLTQKRQALVKSEMDKRMADLVKFSQSFKVRSSSHLDLKHTDFRFHNSSISQSLKIW